jgi:hypothetical protein
MKKLLVLLMVSAVGVVAWKWRGGADAEPTNAKLVVDRLWIDHVPTSDRDTFQLFAALTEDPVGVFQQSSVWQGSYELFRYESQGEEYRMVFPQNGDKDTVRAKARACKEAGMDYCLELSGTSRGAKRYFSRKGWELRSVADEQALAAELARGAQ